MAERASVLRSRCFFYLILKEEAHGYSDCDRRGDHPDLCGSARDAGSKVAETHVPDDYIDDGYEVIVKVPGE